MMNKENSNSETPKTLGARIRDLREKHHLTQCGAALKFHVDASAWNRIEKDNAQPSIQVLQNVSVVWNVSLEYLIAGTVPVADFRTLDLSELSIPDIELVRGLVDRLRNH